MTMKAKKLFGFLMASAMVVSFAACSDDDEFTPVYNLPETQKEIGADGGTITVNMECNVVCTETPEATWITASCEESAKGVCTLTLTVAANDSYDAREGKVKVEFALENGTPLQSFYYTVKQAGQESPYFNTEPASDTIYIDYNEATPTWVFETNCEWAEPTIDADWLTIGLQNETGIRFIAAAFPLPCDSVRIANIEIPYTTATGENLTKKLVVAQSGKDTFEPADMVGKWRMTMTTNAGFEMVTEITFNEDGSIIQKADVYRDGELVQAGTEDNTMTYVTKTIDEILAEKPEMEIPEGVCFYYIPSKNSYNWEIHYNMTTQVMSAQVTIMSTQMIQNYSRVTE